MTDFDPRTATGPSPELAAAVAEKVMGYTVAPDMWWLGEDGDPAAYIPFYRPDLPEFPASQLREAEMSLLADAKSKIRVPRPQGHTEWWPPFMAYGFFLLDAVAPEHTKDHCADGSVREADCAELISIVRTIEPWRACVCLLLAKETPDVQR